jgi:hypothetical protein
MNIPKKCPACAATLAVTELSCPDCRAAVKGSFQLSPLAALSSEDEAFLMAFLRAGGRIKAVEKEMGISYPTVKARLRDLMTKLNVSPSPVSQEIDVEQDKKARQLEILARLKRGEIFTHEAVALLKDLGV